MAKLTARQLKLLKKIGFGMNVPRDRGDKLVLAKLESLGLVQRSKVGGWVWQTEAGTAFADGDNG